MRQKNGLSGEASLYLQQHAENPVDWQPWGEAVWARALREDRLVIVSIGYSTCHWCHVMEHESFENQEVADVMNAHFLAIKVDREERPDVDAAYMTAVQLMTRQGGWPLNVVCLPDGRPVWGGTYFPADRWVASLLQLAKGWHSERASFLDYAAKLASGIRAASLLNPTDPAPSDRLSTLAEMHAAWREHWDPVHGANLGAPKFPLPPALRLLLFRGALGSAVDRAHLVRTLDAIEAGGIHDHVGGGFARYAVDEAWQIPHFEKMLYDNGQLLELYALAALEVPERRDLWARAATRTADWLLREMRRPDGAFAAAVDADSLGPSGELEEGAGYVWSEGEAPDGFTLAFHPELPGGVLQRTSPLTDDSRLADLLDRRRTRPQPAIDRKALTAWNALAIIGLTAAYRMDGRPEDLAAARDALTFLLSFDGLPRAHHENHGGGVSGPGFLEDFALTASACRSLYEVTFDARWADAGLQLTEEILTRFSTPEGNLRTSAHEGGLFTEIESLEDDVIPSGASEAAHNLWWYGTLFSRRDFLERADTLIDRALARIDWLPNAARWAELAMIRGGASLEVGILGGDAATVETTRKALQGAGWWPGVVWFGGATEAAAVDSPAAKGRIGQTTRTYICKEGACNLPCASVEQALQQLRSLELPDSW